MGYRLWQSSFHRVGRQTMNFKTVFVLMLAAGLVSACDSSWTQNQNNFNMNLYAESNFGGSDCFLYTPNSTYNRIRCCGAAADQVGGITTKNYLPTVSKDFNIDLNYTFVAASVSHAYFNLVNVADVSDAQNVNVSSPKVLLGLQMERGSVGVVIYCNGTATANVNGPAGYSTNYEHVQRIKHISGDNFIRVEFWDGNSWEADADAKCPIYDTAGFDDAAYSAVWSFKDDATTKCADLNYLKSVSNITDYGNFFVINSDGDPVSGCTVTDLADYLGSLEPTTYTTDDAGLTDTVKVKLSCVYDNTLGYYTQSDIESVCDGYAVAYPQVIFNTKNTSSLLAIIDMGNYSTAATTTTTTLPGSFKVKDIGIQPAETIPGGQFNVYIRTEKNGQRYTVDDCIYLLAGQEANYTASSMSFAYTTLGNTYGTYQITQGISDYYWTYKNVQTIYVNDTISAGDYNITVICSKGTEDQYGYNSVTILGAGETTISLLGAAPDNVAKSTSQPFVFEYKNATGGLLSGASCDYADNFARSVSLTESPQKRYSGYVFYDTTGNVEYNVTCQVAGYDDATYTGTLTVTGASCFNQKMDGNELGIDCGGDCIPCGGNQTGGDSCGLKYDDCTSDNDCCSGWCGRDANNDRVCLNPSCSDGILNQGEFRVDCGGENCDPCQLCTYDSGCSMDGSQYCNENYTCAYQTCASDADCRILRWDILGVGVVSKPTICDTEAGVCRFDDRIANNNTNIKLGMDIVPVTGFTANSSGTIWYTLNCDDKQNALIISTQANTTTYYSYALSGHTPAIPYDAYLRTFADGTRAAKKTGVLPELCEPVDGFGGIPQGNQSVYARILFRTCQGQECTSKVIDTITYRHNIKNSLTAGVVALTADREYNFTVANRSIFMQIRKSASDQYTNVSTGYAPFVKFNISTIDPDSKSLSMFFIRITTPYGEKYETKYGTAWWMPIKYDKETGWGLNITIRAWMIWILLAAVIIGAVYANYRLQARRQSP